MKTIQDCNFKGKKVLIRVDFNVPLNHNRQVTDDTRIRESLPTIKKILNDGASVILISHLGRPKGGFENDYSLTPLVPVLTKLLGKNIIFTRDLFSQKTIDYCAKLQPGEVILLENIRFYPEEENGTDGEFAKQIASLGDAYVNDAFATSHRAHMSVSVLPKYFPENKFFGLLLANELLNLDKILNDAKPPFTAIIGGAKVSNKIGIIENLINKADNLIIGGGMAFTFIKALGGNIGNSLYEEDKISLAKDMVQEMMLKGVNLYLPTDVVVADTFSNDANFKTCPADDIDEKWMGLDIGKKTCRRYAEIINNSNTILWNGPMGVFELPNFQQGTKAIAIAVAGATISGSFSLVGGGDSVAAINTYNLADQISYVSTGGGAMLEYVEGKVLPGVKAILD
ncbi:MAG TPA: phosphoglycerate kinase [Bacteroidales bacterium]|nr:phosphoglycerate kinase [Bacteroidales bacterium]HPS16779.1 phosphoglycerate kinase [Bacteroidales bacterium]